MRHDTLSPYQVADAFPDECKEFIPNRLKHLRLNLKDFNEKVRWVQCSNFEQDKKDLCMLMIDLTNSIETRKQIKFYEDTLHILKNKNIDDFLADKHALAVAKAKPIETLYSFQKARMTTSRIHASCPFHGKDDNPSFVVYRHTNTYNCFSCSANGDSISFVMRLNKIDFKTAVNSLQTYRMGI